MHYKFQNFLLVHFQLCISRSRTYNHRLKNIAFQAIKHISNFVLQDSELYNHILKNFYITVHNVFNKKLTKLISLLDMFRPTTSVSARTNFVRPHYKLYTPKCKLFNSYATWVYFCRSHNNKGIVETELKIDVS